MLSRRTLTFAIALVVLAVPLTCAGNLGLGIVAGEPTGLCLKTWVGENAALDAVAGWSVGEGGWLYLHADYLRHRYDLDPDEFDGRVSYYFGIGFRLLAHDDRDSRFGIRVPVGLDYIFKDSRFDVFVEVAPTLDLVSETELDWSGGIGVRFWF